MDSKLRVAILFGGKSGEHDISLLSAKSVLNAINTEKYSVIACGITKEGYWVFSQDAISMLNNGLKESNLSDELSEDVVKRLDLSFKESTKAKIPSAAFFDSVDIIFPVVHGPDGEDGTLQGLFEIADVPYVGSGVLASSLAMDKVMSKKILANEGFPQPSYLYFMKDELTSDPKLCAKKVELNLGYPCFVKPANLGSSVGISKAQNDQEILSAFVLASRYDNKVIVEEFIDEATEIEVAVLGNDEPYAPVAGGVLSSNDFYDFNAKYKEGLAEFPIPAPISDDTSLRIREMAINAYKMLGCSGLSRVDFFIDKEGNILLNELNTLPGFTSLSMYPKMMAHAGIEYSELITRLINLGLDRWESKRR